MNPGMPTLKLGVDENIVALRQSPGTVVGGQAVNNTEVDGYLLYFDKPISEVVVGTTVPTYTTRVFALSTGDLCKAGEGVMFMRAISIACVTAITGSTTGVEMDIAAVIQ